MAVGVVQPCGFGEEVKGHIFGHAYLSDFFSPDFEIDMFLSELRKAWQKNKP